MSVHIFARLPNRHISGRMPENRKENHMGSFDVACGISNIAIQEGDRTGFLFLNDVRNEYSPWDETPQSESLVVYHNDHYRPFFAPIYGKYNDYGTIEDIERNTTVEVLENIFGISIEAIVEIVTDSGSGIYNKSGHIGTAFGLNKKAFEYGISDHESLLRLGFTAVNDSEYAFDGARFIKTTSGWSAVREQTKKDFLTRDLGTAVELFGDVIGIYPGYKPSDATKIRAIRKLGGMFFHADVFEEIKSIPQNQWEAEATRRWKEKWDQFMSTFSYVDNGDDDAAEMRATIRLMQSGESVTRNQSVPPEYTGYFASYADSDEMLDLYYFERIVSLSNRFLEPTRYAGQYVEDDTQRAVMAAALRVLDRRKKEYEEDEG